MPARSGVHWQEKGWYHRGFVAATAARLAIMSFVAAKPCASLQGDGVLRQRDEAHAGKTASPVKGRAASPLPSQRS